LTQAQVSLLLGGVTLKPGSEIVQQNGPITIRSCQWTTPQRATNPQNAPLMMISIVQPSDAKPGTITPRQYFDETRQAVISPTSVSGLGDAAFETSQNVYVMKGSTEVVVLVGLGQYNPQAVGQSAIRVALKKVP
jgi:hypothetical protein